MTGYSCFTFWIALFFCAINGYEATGQNVFYKQTADFIPVAILVATMAILKSNSPCPNESFLLIYPVWPMRIEVDHFTSQG